MEQFLQLTQAVEGWKESGDLDEELEIVFIARNETGTLLTATMSDASLVMVAVKPKLDS